MKRMLCKLLTGVVLSLAIGGSALACRVEGRVTCEPLGLPLEGAKVTIAGATLGNVTLDAYTDANGNFLLALPDILPATYTATLTVAEGTINGSPTTTFDLTASSFVASINWTVSNVPGCGQVGCWLTGGGAKFSTIIGMTVAERGPRVNFGGNVNPSCSPEPGEGGQWNHLDHQLKLHFQGTQIVVDRCGNVSGIPPGSTSPVTPYNFIEYSGTGVLKGISGNKAFYPNVCFTARAEDRNEPGSTGERDGAYKDRYFIRVFDCGSGATLLVLEETPGAGDPVAITDGNLQIHISSCASQ